MSRHLYAVTKPECECWYCTNTLASEGYEPRHGECWCGLTACAYSAARILAIHSLPATPTAGLADGGDTPPLVASVNAPSLPVASESSVTGDGAAVVTWDGATAAPTTRTQRERVCILCRCALGSTNGCRSCDLSHEPGPQL